MQARGYLTHTRMMCVNTNAMYSIMIMGFLAALSAFILIWKINIEWFCCFYWQTDLVFAILVTWLFYGTFSGMATAAVAGVTFSAMLFLARLVQY